MLWKSRFFLKVRRIECVYTCSTQNNVKKKVIETGVTELVMVNDKPKALKR